MHLFQVQKGGKTHTHKPILRKNQKRKENEPLTSPRRNGIWATSQSHKRNNAQNKLFRTKSKTYNYQAFHLPLTPFIFRERTGQNSEHSFRSPDWLVSNDNYKYPIIYFCWILEVVLTNLFCAGFSCMYCMCSISVIFSTMVSKCPIWTCQPKWK